MITAGQAHAAMASLPVGTLGQILSGQRALVLAPHPDDESLGCGGLIAEAVRLGTPPLVLILTDGAASHPNSRRFPPERVRALRRAEAIAAVAALGLGPDRIGFLEAPDAATETSGPRFEILARRIADAAREDGSRVILASWRHDPHCDHLAAHLLAARAAALAGLRHIAYPVWGLTLAEDVALDGPLPEGWRLDVRAALAAKRAAIEAHRTQLTDLIDDDPDGFRLPAALLDRMLGPHEIFMTNP